MRSPTQKPITRDEAELAAASLGFPVLDGLEENAVLGAFRRAVRLAHPDTGATPEEAAELIAKAREARRVLLRWFAELPDAACPQCDGSGWVSAGNGRIRACSRCG